jgi:hypothetical protein
MVRACNCPHAFIDAQARFAARLRDMQHRHNPGSGRIAIHTRCLGCGTDWLLLWTPERRTGADRRWRPEPESEA